MERREGFTTAAFMPLTLLYRLIALFYLFRRAKMDIPCNTSNTYSNEYFLMNRKSAVHGRSTTRYTVLLTVNPSSLCSLLSALCHVKHFDNNKHKFCKSSEVAL